MNLGIPENETYRRLVRTLPRHSRHSAELCFIANNNDRCVPGSDAFADEDETVEQGLGVLPGR